VPKSRNSAITSPCRSSLCVHSYEKAFDALPESRAAIHCQNPIAIDFEASDKPRGQKSYVKSSGKRAIVGARIHQVGWFYDFSGLQPAIAFRSWVVCWCHICAELRTVKPRCQVLDQKFLAHARAGKRGCAPRKPPEALSVTGGGAGSPRRRSEGRISSARFSGE
jgi:hypothetical protein